MTDFARPACLARSAGSGEDSSFVGEDEKAKTSTAPGLYVSGPQSAREPARAAGQPPAAVASARGRWPEAVSVAVRQKPGSGGSVRLLALYRPTASARCDNQW